MTRKTVLNDTHRALGARMVDFGGWDMPLNYGSQIEEHHAVRRDCGMFDVSHMCPVDVHGDDALAFLCRLLANDPAKLRQPGKALYSCMLNETGGVIDDLIVYFLEDNFFRLVVNAGTADKDIAWMQAPLAAWSFAVELQPRRDLALIAVQGPNARARFWQARPDTRSASEMLAPFFAARHEDWLIARTGYTGEDGFEIMLPAGQAEALWEALQTTGVLPCGLGARDTLRLEAGMNLYGQDMDETVSPLDAGLAWTVSLTGDRQFVGRQAIETRGQQSAFLGLVLPAGGVLRNHMPVVTRLGNGEITSGSFSPTLQQSIALARLPIGTAIDDLVAVDLRGKRLSARVVHPPFVRHGQPQI